MRLFFLVFFFFIPTLLYAGQFYNVVHGPGYDAPQSRAISYIESFLSRDDLNIGDVYSIVSDLRDYMILSSQDVDAEKIAYFLMYNKEIVVLLTLLNDQSMYGFDGEAKIEMIENGKILLRLLLPLFKSEDLILSKSLNIDDFFEEKLAEAFQSWKFERKFSETKSVKFTHMCEQVFKSYTEAFIKETEELLAWDLRQMPSIILRDRLGRLRVLLSKELTFCDNYKLNHELTVKLLFRDLTHYGLMLDGKRAYTGRDLREVLGDIIVMLKKVLVEMSKPEEGRRA